MKSHENAAFESDGEFEKRESTEDDKDKLRSDEMGVGKYVYPEEGSRPAWDNQVQFLLACIAFAVGLGNIWRFPYLAQSYGGGAFLIPYIIMLIVEGIPLFFIELALGQRMRRGPIKVWTRFHPYLKGIGFASMITAFFIGLYYNTIVAWCFWYLFNSFQELPYSSCPISANKTSIDPLCAKVGPTEYFWYKETLNITEGIDDQGGLVWWIVICLVLAWATVWVAMLNGIESSGKVMYFTATFPYVVLTIFLIRGLTLKGSSDGLAYLFTPDLEVLKNPSVWLDAATQIFFSLSVGIGGVTAFASYNPKKQDVQRDVLIISFANSFTSIFASMVIFSILGFRATQTFDTCVANNTQVMLDYYNLPEGGIPSQNYDSFYNNYTKLEGNESLVYCNLTEYLNEKSEGTGLAFVVFTEAIINMPGSPFWSVLFFLMLLSLGLGTMFGTVEGVATPLFDLGLKIPKPLLIGIISAISCLLGLIFCTRAGNYWLEIFNDYAGSIPLLVITFCEVMVVAWGYGTRRFDEDVAYMIGGPKSVAGYCLHWYFRLCWTFISPLVLFVVFVAYLYVQVTEPIRYEAWVDGESVEKAYPWYGTFVIVCLIVLPLICIPAYWIGKAVHTSVKQKTNEGILCERKWRFNDVAFWKNKYDKKGELKR